METVLTAKDEQSSNQSLDYAMHFTLESQQTLVKVQPEV